MFRCSDVGMRSLATHPHPPTNHNLASIYVMKNPNIGQNYSLMSTYGHRCRKIRDPVRSPIVKSTIAGLVVGSVTTSEYLVLYVLLPFWRL
jgi:hypothetical protein